MRVDAQGELRVGVPELVRDMPGIAAERNEDRSEGVPELVGRHAAWERVLAAVGQQLVGPFEHGLEHALVDVVLVTPAAARRREEQVVEATGGCPVRRGTS